MFQIGDYVVYGTNGICEVKDISTLDISGANKEREYYVLEPMRAKGNHSFVPVDSDRVLIRNVITKTQAQELIQEIPSVEALGEMDDKTRELRYKEIVKQCECKSWVCLLKTIYLRKRERVSLGKKMTATDERYLKLAQDNLYEELAFALGLEKANMESYMMEQLNGMMK